MEVVIKALLSLLWMVYIWGTTSAINEVASSIDQCCDQVFLSAGEVIATNQGGLLGIYNWTGTHANSAYYTKDVYGMTMYFYYKRHHGSTGRDSPGWTVSTSLDGRSLFVATRSSITYRYCPVGILGAYDRDEEYDPTFSVKCHSDIIGDDEGGVKEECCFSVWVSATATDGAIWSNQNVFVGKYDLMGETFNGYPVYHKVQWGIDSYISYSKEGDLRKDGWILNNKIGVSYSPVTTRDRRSCPAGITTAYDRNKYQDDSFRVDCDSNVFEQTTPFSLWENEEETTTDITTGRLDIMDGSASEQATTTTTLSHVETNEDVTETTNHPDFSDSNAFEQTNHLSEWEDEETTNQPDTLNNYSSSVGDEKASAASSLMIVRQLLIVCLVVPCSSWIIG